MSEYHFCSGRMSGGRRPCYFKGVIKVNKKWWCKRHAAQESERLRRFQESKKKNEVLTDEELQAIKKVVVYYRVNKTLGKKANYKELWASMVPRLLEEVLLRRKIE